MEKQALADLANPLRADPSAQLQGIRVLKTGTEKLRELPGAIAAWSELLAPALT
jgi:hypothetical protein